MWFNSIQNVRPHQVLTYCRLSRWKHREIRKDDSTAAAWLSSARAVGCFLKWKNERNPYPMLYVSLETAPEICSRNAKNFVNKFRGRKERTTSSQHGAYDLGNTHTTMTKNNGTQARKRTPISCKFRLSSDWGLQPDPMKSESVVIADQHAAVNTFSGLVHTARQANKVGGGRTPSFWALVVLH